MDLQQMIEDAGFETRSYSGRGMYGAECLGVEIDKDLGGFLGDLLDSALALSGPESVPVIVEALRGMKTDSMGLGLIVYFPEEPFRDEDAEPDHA